MTTALNPDQTAVREALLKGLQLLTGAGIFSTDAELKITSWSAWLETHTGVSTSRALGQNVLDLFPEIVERRLDRFYRQALDGQVVVLSQLLHQYLLRLRPSITDIGLPTMPQSARIAPLVEAGSIVGTVTWIEDVSERIMREAELAARMRQQSAIATLTHEALASRSLDELFEKSLGIIARTLEIEHCALFQLVSGSLKMRSGLGWTDGLVQLDAEQAASLTRALAQPTLAQGARLSDFEPPEFMRKQGIVDGLSVAIHCGGNVYGLLGAYRREPWDRLEESVDFIRAAANVLGTAIERDGLERSLRERAHELMQADRRKNEFLAMLAHELRNPLAPIRNAIHLLHLKQLDETELRQARELMDRQLQQITRLVDDLLDVSRITRGKIQLRLEDIDLAEVISQALETSRPSIELQGHELTVKLSKEPMPMRGDATRLSQAIANLIHNATKYTAQGGKIAVTAERHGSDYVVRVRDNGIGISPEMLPQIFDLFTQVDNSLARSEGGLGIGLTIVRTLVEMHGGTVRAFSEGANQGSEFVIRLPVMEAADQRAPDIADSPCAPSEKSRKVLVVDDNVDAAQSLAQLLRALGHDCRSIHTGPAALEEAQQLRPDVVFLDIGLPGMDGFEVARRMREDAAGQRLTLVALSGYGENAQSKDAGFDLHVIKPMEMGMLRRIMADLPSG